MARVVMTALTVLWSLSAFAAPKTDGASGDWQVFLNMPVFAYHTSMSLDRRTATGTFNFENDPVPLVFREDALGNFAATFEVPAVNSPVSSAVTVVLRGTRTGENISGTALFVTDVPDPASCTGFATIWGTWTATRMPRNQGN